MVGEAFNAISLAAFNGVFSALLTETYDGEHRRRDHTNVLKSFGNWQSIAMAVAAAIGACFYMNASPTVWWVAAVLLAITTLFSPRLLLAGVHRPLNHSHAPYKKVDASSKKIASGRR